MTRRIIPGILLERIQYFICGFADSVGGKLPNTSSGSSQDDETGGRKERHSKEQSAGDHSGNSTNFCFV